MCVRDPIIRRKGQQAPARKLHVTKAEKELNTDCSKSSRKRHIMSLLEDKEARIENADKKEEMNSDSSAMLMRDLLCAEVVEEQQIQIQNCNNQKEITDQSAALLKDLMCGEVLWPEFHNGSISFFCTTPSTDAYIEVKALMDIVPSTMDRPFDDYTKTRANSSRCILSAPDEGLLDHAKVTEFEEAMGVLLEREGLIYYKLSTVYLQSLKAGCKIAAATGSSCRESSLSSTRRRSVNWIFKLVRFLKMGTMTAAHAVAFMDRFLSQRILLVEMESEMQLAATACLWIAAKMQDNCPLLLSSLQDVAVIGSVEEQRIWDMEAVVLHDLEWRMVAVTVSDFVVNMVAHLEASRSLPLHLVPKAIHRADLIIHAILPEVEFLDYEPSVVGICVMQCLLDEIMPIQAASHMAFMRRALAVDMVAVQQCYHLLVDMVVDPLYACSLPSPDRVLDHRS